MRNHNYRAATVLMFLVCANCQTKSKSDVRYSEYPTSLGWVVVEEGRTVRISVDTSGLKLNPGPQAMWIALDESNTRGMRSPASPSSRYETRQEIDCDKKVARGLDIRTPDSTGHLYVMPVRRSSFMPFANAKLGAATLGAVCRKLDDLKAHVVALR
jgi:hypothetical protein